jgi:Ala-tRNA(Pro) deacylase
VDVQAVKALMRGTCVAFASSEIAERLAGSVTGTILPFSFNPELALMQRIGIRRVLSFH